MVLDTSAILTLIEDEPGAARVQEILEQGTAVIPWVVLLEAYYISYQERGQDEADLRYALMKRLPVTFDDVLDEPRLLTAGRLKASHRLSLADAIIAAPATRLMNERRFNRFLVVSSSDMRTPLIVYRAASRLRNVRNKSSPSSKN